MALAAAFQSVRLFAHQPAADAPGHNDSYLEASATAGFAYGILKAIRKRYISRDYTPVAERALQGVIERINDAGELTQVSFGTAMGNDLDYYRQVPQTSMPYGQAMALLCLTEYLRVYL